MVIPDAPRSVNDVSCLMKISHENPFAWQAQNLESPVVPHGANDVSYATRIIMTATILGIHCWFAMQFNASGWGA